MNLQALVGIVRAVGLCCAITLVGCDSGGEKKDAPKAEEKKVEAKAEEKKAAPEEKKADPPAEAKAADPAPAGDAKAPADPPAGDAKAPAGDAKAPAGDAKAAAPGIDGRPLYEAKCKVCHAADGKGTEAMKKNKIPDMTVADWQSKHDKASIVKAITDGIDGTKMKAFKDKLKPEEIEAVAVYVKGMK